jgi:hypothetical protein
MSEPIGFLKDANGDNSSKRLWGSISMVLGLAMKLCLSILALTSWIPVAEVALRLSVALGAADGVLMAGTALLGIGVVEGFQPKPAISNNENLGV